MNFNFFRFLEFTAILPIFAISLACLYKYSFYSALDVPWVLSQLQLSGVLLNAVPIFLDMFLGFSTVAAIYIYFRSVFDEIRSYVIVIVFFPFLLGVVKFLNWDVEFLTSVLDKSIFLYTYLITGTIFYALESTGFIKSISVGICIFSLIFLQTLIDYKSYKEMDKLFNHEGSFSRVYFTDEGNKLIPTEYTSTNSSTNEEKTYSLDWRLLEIVGDKAIIIVSNKVKLDGIDKPQIRIIDYKLIDRLY